MGLPAVLIACELACNARTAYLDRRDRQGPQDWRHEFVTLCVLGAVLVVFYRFVYVS